MSKETTNYIRALGIISGLIVGMYMVSICYAADDVRVQVRFRKGIFHCQDGTEEVVDFNVGGGNTYEHTCSDGKWTNSFTEYNGALTYSQTEYEKVTTKDIEAAKDKKIEDWQYEKAHPPKYVEPSVEDYQDMIDSKLAEVEEMTAKIAEKKSSTKDDVVEVKNKLDEKSDKAQEIADKK